MKLINFYNYECSQVLQVRLYTCLKTDPVVSNNNAQKMVLKSSYHHKFTIEPRKIVHI